jgi:hypothetical protein
MLKRDSSVIMTNTSGQVIPYTILVKGLPLCVTCATELDDTTDTERQSYILKWFYYFALFKAAGSCLPAFDGDMSYIDCFTVDAP